MISNFITKLAQQLAMLAVSLFAVPLASAQTSPAADMQLITDLHHMQVQVNQSAPLPPGGCNSGYAWHTTYGGCRTPKPETETAACAANHTGSRTRTRTGYTLQANSSDIKYGQWGAWKDNCIEEITEEIRGDENSDFVFAAAALPGYSFPLKPQNTYISDSAYAFAWGGKIIGIVPWSSRASWADGVYLISGGFKYELIDEVIKEYEDLVNFNFWTFYKIKRTKAN